MSKDDMLLPGVDPGARADKTVADKPVVFPSREDQVRSSDDAFYARLAKAYETVKITAQPAPSSGERRSDNHQSGGVGMVQPRDWQRSMPHCRHLVADRKWSDSDFADARRGTHQARLGDAAHARHHSRYCRPEWQSRRHGSRRLPDHPPSLAEHGTYHLGDPERFKEQYWSKVPGAYFTGDAARRDVDGYYWVLGRVDDVMNVSGHRLSTMEVESALVRHPAVAEAAVVGKPHEITGLAVCCFVTLKKGEWDHDALGKELRQWVAHEIGAFARPEEIRFSDALPKTRSGKIMRRLLREIVTTHTVAGDVTTLEDMSVVTRLAAQQEED